MVMFGDTSVQILQLLFVSPTSGLQVCHAEVMGTLTCLQPLPVIRFIKVLIYLSTFSLSLHMYHVCCCEC